MGAATVGETSAARSVGYRWSRAGKTWRLRKRPRLGKRSRLLLVHSRVARRKWFLLSRTFLNATRRPRATFSPHSAQTSVTAGFYGVQLQHSLTHLTKIMPSIIRA